MKLVINPRYAHISANRRADKSGYDREDQLNYNKRKRTHNDLKRNAAAHKVYIVTSDCHRICREHYDTYRCDLHAARSRCRGATREHHKESRKLGSLRKRRIIHSGKSRRSPCHRLEERVEYLRPNPHLTDGLGVVPFKKRNYHRAADNVYKGQYQHKFRINAEALSFFSSNKFIPYGETDASE